MYRTRRDINVLLSAVVLHWSPTGELPVGRFSFDGWLGGATGSNRRLLLAVVDGSVQRAIKVLTEVDILGDGFH